MKKIFTLLTAISIGSFSFGQVVFQSDLSTWAAGDPTDWMGAKSNILPADVIEVPAGSSYGSSDAQLVNATATHKRFTTQAIDVTLGMSYEIKFWVKGQGQIRTGLFDDHMPTSSSGYQYNSYITVNSATPVEYSQSITALATNTTDAEFILSVLSTVGPGHLIVDSVSITEGTPPPPTIVSIYDIQYTTAMPAESPEMGNVVTTKGVVTGVFQIGGDVDRFFIQDGDGAWNGIFIYENAYPVAIGDSVLVTGEVQEFMGLTEIGFVSNVTILNSGNTLPTPAVVTNATIVNEEWEGVLVTVQDAICTSVTDAFGEWIVNDPSAGANLNVDDNLMPATFTSVLGNGYDIIGVRHYSFSENVLLPRTELADIITVGFAGIEENSSLSIYPNPATDNVVMNVQPNSIVRIYSVSGAMVYEGIGKTTLDVSTFDAGIYQVTVTTNETTSTQKLIIQ